MKSKKPKTNTGKIVYKFRKDCGLTIKEMADEAGLKHYQLITSFENGHKIPSRNEFKSLCSIMNEDVLFRAIKKDVNVKLEDKYLK